MNVHTAHDLLEGSVCGWEREPHQLFAHRPGVYTEMTKNLAGGGNLPYVEVCKCAEQNGREECVYGTLRSTVSVYRILFLFIFATKFF